MDEAPPPPWRRTSTPRRTSIDTDVVVAAGLELLDAEGVDSLSMRRLAAKLGVSAGLLYRYLNDKDELLDLLLEEVLGEVAPTRSEDWQADLRGLATQIHGALLSHRDVARIAVTRIVPTGPNALRVAEALLECLRRAGLDDDQLSPAADAVSALVQGSALEHGLDPERHLPGEGSVDERLRAIGQYFTSLPATTFPVIRSLGPRMSAGTAEERFAFALDIVVRGIAATVRARA